MIKIGAAYTAKIGPDVFLLPQAQKQLGTLRARLPAVGKNPFPVTFLKKFKVFLNLFSLYIDHTNDLAFHFPL
jgi:hypothetical protein